jgi:hypothetical protein
VLQELLHNIGRGPHPDIVEVARDESVRLAAPQREQVLQKAKIGIEAWVRAKICSSRSLPTNAWLIVSKEA